MFEPKFQYTSSIVNHLTTIERLYAQLLAEKLIPSLALKLTQENQILATHHSTSIEGNPLSPIDVTNLILGDQIPVTKSELEVKNYFSALNSSFVLAKNLSPITTELIKKLHTDLMQGIIKKGLGELRDDYVFVGHKTAQEIVIKHNPPFHTAKEIENALDKINSWVMDEDPIHPLIKAGIYHHQFVYIHPFFDGNGRLARILTSYYLLLKKYEVDKFFILDDYYDIDRQLYSDSLHTADEKDETHWIEYFLEGIAHSLQAALSRVQKFKKTNVDELTGEKRVLVTAREEEVLQLIIQRKAVKTPDIQELFSVTRQQAHSLLASLVKKGILEKFGRTKMSYYKVIDHKDTAS